MKKSFNFCQLALIAVAAVLMLSGSAFAHHGAAAYDTGKEKEVTVTGTVTGFNFINPHAVIMWDAKDASGKVEHWQGELTSPNRLTRSGWNKNTLQAGDQVVITGGRAKTGTTTLWINKVVKNGQQLSLAMGN